MRRWTPEEKQRQRERLLALKPWKLSTGPKTQKGKAKSRKNALKHCNYGTEIKEMRRFLKECRELLERVGEILP